MHDDRSRSEPSAVAVPALNELAAALKHDLGKYVAWMSSNLPEEAWSGDVDDAWIDAIRSDVLETRRGTEVVETAWQVFDRLTRGEPRPWRAPELERVAVAVELLRTLEHAIRGRDRTALGERRAAIRSAQVDIRRELAALHRRVSVGG